MANAPSENPIVSPTLGKVAHHGAFHAVYLVQSLDALVLAMAQSAQLSLARLTMLAESAYTGQHPFLGDGTPAASGVMILEYSAASALVASRALATPAGIQVVNLSRGVEEDASFATLAARQSLEAVSRFRAVLAAELVASLRCLRMQGARPPALHDALDYLDESDGGSLRDERPRPHLRPAPGRGTDRRPARPRGCSAARWWWHQHRLILPGRRSPGLRSERSERLETTHRNLRRAALPAAEPVEDCQNSLPHKAKLEQKLSVLDA